MRIKLDNAANLVLISEEGRRVFSYRERMDEAYGIACVLRERLGGEERKIIGLIFPTSEELFVHWFGVLLAGMEPTILHYPTQKTNFNYYEASLNSAVKECGVNFVLHSGEITSTAFPHMVLGAVARQTYGKDYVDIHSIIQLSSGTTGTRKGIRFTGEQLELHAINYNKHLQLDPARDQIVSWLPLYHDMGFIACWCMPLFLGVPVVMMDPMYWVRNPQIFFDVIERERPTVTFMPNFGFEVMARSGKHRDLSSMRAWISCSEPTRARTLRKFSDAAGVPMDRLANCYAMAENVFAVAHSVGIQVASVDEREIVSCGLAINGTEVRVKGDQLWVRSQHALTGYLGAPAEMDEAGFYCTGDLGFIKDDQIFVTGRLKDVLNVAGRKFIASEIDEMLHELYPEARGREAVLTVESALTGTEQVVVAIERSQYWREDFSGLALQLGKKTGIEGLEIRGVPKGFLTKTTSGKINRKASAADYNTAIHHQKTLAKDTSSAPREELMALFGNLPMDIPCGRLLDSLGLTTLRIFLDSQRLEYKPDNTLRTWLARIENHRDIITRRERKTFDIVACTDRNYYPYIDHAFLSHISSMVGVPVNYEHICVPPAPVLINDLIFERWFAPRRPDLKLDGVRYALNRLRKASLVLFDDQSEIFWPYGVPQKSYYPLLSHSFRRDPAAEYLAVRWARYSSHHDELPIELMAGSSIDRAHAGKHLDELAALLGTTVAKVAIHPGLAEWTKDWDIHAFMEGDVGQGVLPLNNAQAVYGMRDKLLAGLSKFIIDNQNRLDYAKGEGHFDIKVADQPHFCSWLVPHEAIAAAVSRHSRYVICGLPSSLPVMRRLLEANGCSYCYSPTLDVASIPHDAIIQNGSWGRAVTKKTIYALMGNGDGTTIVQAPEEEVNSFPAVSGDPAVIIDAARARAATLRLTNGVTFTRSSLPNRYHVHALLETSLFLQLLDVISLVHRQCRNLPRLRAALVGTDPLLLSNLDDLDGLGMTVTGCFGVDTEAHAPGRLPWNEFRVADYDIILLAPRSTAEYNKFSDDLLKFYLNRAHPNCPLVHVNGMHEGFRKAADSLIEMPFSTSVRRLCVFTALLAQTKRGMVAVCDYVFPGDSALLLGALVRQWKDTRKIHIFDFSAGPSASGEVANLASNSADLAVNLLTTLGLGTHVTVHRDGGKEALLGGEEISLAFIHAIPRAAALACLDQLAPRLATNGLIVVSGPGISGLCTEIDEIGGLGRMLSRAILPGNMLLLWGRTNAHFLSNTS